MRILILGGTVFVGRSLTGAAIAAGHDVTHFNRGHSAPPDPRVRTIHGDRTRREALVEARDEGPWDAVIDTSGYLPQVVRLSVEAFANARRYLFVSSISVYQRFAREGFDEDSDVAEAPDPPPDTLTMELYGPLKAACEAVVRHGFGERATIVRPGLIVGPHDPTDRFTYWPVRIAAGGAVLAPGRPSRGVQFIDVRDLAEWMVRLLEGGAGGTFNATGPREPLPMARFLEACRVVAGSDADLHWVDDAFLLRHEVAPWRELPLWIPESDDATFGLMAAHIGRAIEAGLAFRPVEETIADTLAWARSLSPGREWKAGLRESRERELLAARDG